MIVGDVDFGNSFVTEADAAYVFSGRTGEILRTITGTNGYEHVGSNVGPAGDVDADGHDDFYVSAYNGHSGNIAGIVRVYSGIDGSQISEYIGGGTIFDLGLRVVADRDFDGDGTPDVVTTYRNGVRAYSGADGSLIIDIPAGFNSSMTVLDDLDGDGTLEVAVGYNGFGYWHGQVTVYSGASGSVLFTLDGLTQFEAFGADLAAGGSGHRGSR